MKINVIKKYYIKILRTLLNYYYNGSFILDEEWDNLIILDACRYDTFKDNNFLQGKLEYRISKGSTTREFLTKNFIENNDETYNDIIYISDYREHACFRHKRE